MTDMERPDADVLEQQREHVPVDEQELESIGEIPVETNESDVIEQHRVVPVDDEE